VKQGAHHQLLRYGLVGGVVYGSDFMAFAVTLWLSGNLYLVANIVGKIAGAAVGFVLHRQFTFSWKQRDGLTRQALLYTGLLLANMVGSSLLLELLVDVANIDAYLARFFVDTIVIATSFVAGRLWIYRPA